MVVAALVLTLLAQSKPPPPREVAVLVSRRVGMGEVRGQALARKVSDYLKSQGFDKVIEPGESVKALSGMAVKDSAECEGKRECVSGLGRFLRAWGVVSIDLADVNDTLALHFEVLLSDTNEKAGVLDIVLPSKKAEVELSNRLGPIAVALHAALDAISAKDRKGTPADAPVVTELKPQEPAAEVQQAPPMPKAHVGALVTTAGAVVGGALVVLFVSQASTAQRQLDGARTDRNGGPAVAFTESQARTLATRANDNYSAALALGIGSAALAVASAILWAQK